VDARHQQLDNSPFGGVVPSSVDIFKLLAEPAQDGSCIGIVHNDFIIIGPAEDPAKIKGETDAEVGL
jgi:hypothetical protein